MPQNSRPHGLKGALVEPGLRAAGLWDQAKAGEPIPWRVAAVGESDAKPLPPVCCCRSRGRRRCARRRSQIGGACWRLALALAPAGLRRNPGGLGPPGHHRLGGRGRRAATWTVAEANRRSLQWSPGLLSRQPAFRWLPAAPPSRLRAWPMSRRGWCRRVAPPWELKRRRPEALAEACGSACEQHCRAAS